jgi:hypothetical protein
MSTKDFFQEYPEAEDILPVYSPNTVAQWTGETENPFPSLSGSDTFPTAEKEYSAWLGGHLLSPREEGERKKREISERYATAFQARIRELLSFVGPKTPADRTNDLLEIRKDFFAYPVQIERGFLDAFSRKKIDSWENIDEESLKKEDSFRDYWKEAIEYSQAAVPSFDQKKHLSPHFSGFVRQVKIMPEKIEMYSVPSFTAKGAYIQNGKIIWSIHDKERSGSPTHLKESAVRWHSGNFILEEEYVDDWIRRPEEEAPKPASQKREAVFQFNNPIIKEARVTQRLYNGEEQFIIDIRKTDNTYQTVKLPRSTHRQTLVQIKNNPSFLTDAENIKALMTE